MADPILLRAGRIVLKNGRIVLARAGFPCSCCGEPPECEFYRYLPCFDDTALPPEHCPLPDPVYVTTCWRCTSGGPSTQTIKDTAGFCWTRDGPQRYLPNPGTGEEPPAGIEWIPDEAVVWDVTEGPCAESCLDPTCRLFDEYIPAHPCGCSPDPAVPVAYFRCSDLDSRDECVVGLAPINGRCYQIDFSKPSVPGPVDPLLVIPRPFFANCCRCCDSQSFGCETSTMGLRRAIGCPLQLTTENVPVCCDADYAVQVGSSVVVDFAGAIAQGCPPDKYERWWYFDRTGGTVWWRHEVYDGSCNKFIDEGSQPRTSIRCDSPFRHEMLPEYPRPDNLSLFCYLCESSPGVLEELNTIALTETPQASHMTVVARWPADCSKVAVSASAVVVRYSSTGTCSSQCGPSVPGLGPSVPVLPLEPGGGNSGPGAYGFVTVDTVGPGGVIIPRVAMRGVRRPPLVRVARNVNQSNVRKGGCGSCNKDGGI